MEKNKVKLFENKITYIVVSCVSILNLLLWLSTKPVWGFVGNMSFIFAPYLVAILMAAVIVVSLIITLWKPNKILLIICFSFDIVFLLASAGYFFGLINYYLLSLKRFGEYLGIALIIAIVITLIFYFPKFVFKGKKVVAIILAVAMCGGVLFGMTDLKNLWFHYVETGAVVYAVEDEYQIVWTMSNHGTGYVKVGDETYYDMRAGSLNTVDTVHKVHVPMEKLNAAKKYTIGSRHLIFEEAFSGLYGGTVEKTYNFRPVNLDDGLQYYTLADVHDSNSAAIKTGSYWGDKLDFLILDGDMVSFIEHKSDLSRANKLANKITNGETAVIYARGNHEVKGNYAEQLYKYVGCNKDNEYYYTVNLNGVWGVVLDIGEDHADEWCEFFDTAHFDEYQKKQIEWLKTLSTTDGYNKDGIMHRLAISHTPMAFVSAKEPYMYDNLVAFNEVLNTLDIDVMINGHRHLAFLMDDGYEAGTKLAFDKSYSGQEENKQNYIATGANYKTVLVSKRGKTYDASTKNSNMGTYLIGAAFEMNDGKIIARLTDKKHNVMYTYNAFTGEEYGEEMVLK